MKLHIPVKLYVETIQGLFINEGADKYDLINKDDFESEDDYKFVKNLYTILKLKLSKIKFHHHIIY